jgi:HAD superfamily hydrolase (TIGR01484 family)
MKPLSTLDAKAIRFVLADIDDTLTSAGKLTAQAYAALESLQRAGKKLVAVTGRPAGWCDHIARMWPLEAVVGENGAFYFWFADGTLGKRFVDDAATRARHRRALRRIAKSILSEVPGAALASDQPYRETDLAIDYCEDVAPLPLSTAERVASLMREAGLSAKVSSIHVNGWFGHYDKLAAVRLLFAERFGLDLQGVNHEVVYAGDSPNDAPMFEFFENSVGVANVRRFPGLRPKYLAAGEAGAGFAELAAHLLRGSPRSDDHDHAGL